MQQINTGLLSPVHQDGAFLWLYSLDGRPYEKRLAEGSQGPYPMVLASLRWDGSFGTMGGKVDPGESLRDAVRREAHEELSFDVRDDDILEPLATYRDGGWHMHSFSLCVPYSRLAEAREKASAAQRSAEVAGVVLVPAFAYPAKLDGTLRGIDAFRQMKFFCTSKLELEALLVRIAEALQPEPIARSKSPCLV